MPLPHIEERCAEETGRYLRALAHDTRPCFEIFRRAFMEGNQLAWASILRIYGALVSAWVMRHPATLRVQGADEDYVNLAFERMWSAITPAKFARFDSLAGVLAYLKLCVHSAVVEEARREGGMSRARSLDDTLPGADAGLPADPGPGVERVVLAEETRHAVRSAVANRMNNDKERLVVRGLFELDLKPGAIHALHPGVFASVEEIYLIRQVVLDRLGRDPVLRRVAAEAAW
jgi:DNA-directed RNA polymerase specialized sigma24 family protein